MALIKSISGIRGTIGGKPGSGLTPVDIVRYTTAYAAWISANSSGKKIIIGRDGRISGEMVRDLVAATLIGAGFDVLDLGLSTTPTVEMAVSMESAAGGIILTASHNPKQWNALKLLNEKGEFLSAEAGQWILNYAENEEPVYAEIDHIGRLSADDQYIDRHIEAILEHPLVRPEQIREKGLHIIVDAVNSTGAISVPPLLKALGVEKITVIHQEVTGDFAHNPEPLPEHLQDLCREVVAQKADLGIAIDPDVDRLCFVCEDGSLFGEEYTLVAVADYILQHKKGNTVSNLSSTRALKDITEKHGGKYSPSAVGEVNVVQKMKEVQAVIGGEGNGGIIVPELHYGRDALIGIALFLTHLAESGKTIRELRNTYPDYFISKNKIELTPDIQIPALLEQIRKFYKDHPANTEDGLKIIFENGDWVHLRASNTEPIIRIYAESTSESASEALAQDMMRQIQQFL